MKVTNIQKSALKGYMFQGPRPITSKEGFNPNTYMPQALQEKQNEIQASKSYMVSSRQRHAVNTWK